MKEYLDKVRAKCDELGYEWVVYQEDFEDDYERGVPPEQAAIEYVEEMNSEHESLKTDAILGA